MDKYTLKYFNVKGLGEPIRFLFAWSGVDFEDVRYTLEDWPKIKNDQPYGQLPLLVTPEGVVLTQSTAISRYLGRTLGLAPDDDLKNAKLDALVQHLSDLASKFYTIKPGSPEFEACYSVTLPFYLQKFNEAAADGWFYGDTITWVDIYFAGYGDNMETKLKADILKGYPNLDRIRKKVLEKPSMQKYLQERPVCVR